MNFARDGVDFIDAHAKGSAPFFLYYAFAHMHVVSPRFHFRKRCTKVAVCGCMCLCVCVLGEAGKERRLSYYLAAGRTCCLACAAA